MSDSDPSTIEQPLQEGVQKAQQGDLQAVAPILEQALELAREAQNLQFEGLALGNLGLVTHFLGNYSQAATYHQQSLTLDRQLSDPALRNPDNLSNQGDYSWGEYTLNRIIGTQKSLGYGLFSLGFAYYWQNDYANAIDCYTQSLDIARTLNDRPNEIFVLAQLGEVYFYLANYHTSLEYHQRAIAIIDDIGVDTSQELQDAKGNSLNSSGNALIKLGNWQQARGYYEQTLTTLGDGGDLNAKGNAVVGIGITYANQNNHHQAIQYFEQGLPLFQADRNIYNEGRLYSLMGQSHYFLGEDAKAIEQHQKSLDISRKLQEPFSEAITLTELGVVNFRLGQLAVAETHLRQAIDLVEAIRARLGNDDNLKVSIFERQAEPYQLLQATLVAQGKIEAALEISERGRARAFTELLAQRTSEASVPRVPTVQESQQLAIQQQATLVEYSIVQTKGLEPGQLFIWVILPSGQIEFQSIDFDLQQTPAIDGLVQATRNMIGVRGLSTVEKSERDLGPSSDSAKELANVHQQLQALHQLLIAPIRNHLPNDPDAPIIVIPHGPLFLIPFAALLDDQNHYLLQNHTLSIAPSLQSLILIRQRQSQTANGSALVIGNPAASRLPIDGQSPLALPPLHGAEAEANAIAPLLKTQPVTGAEATKALVLERMANAPIIHLAAHGLLDDTDGLGSAIALTPTDQDNGLLTAETIAQLALQAELVVLSACNTGRGRLTGDGVIGLSRSFIAAGVSSVIVSLWAISDAPTVSLMKSFYEILEEVPSKTQALRLAMLATLENHPHPRNWAAFLMVGQG